MNSFDKLLTNTTNRFQALPTNNLAQFQSNFTPIFNPQHSFEPAQSKNFTLFQHLIDMKIPQTYEQLEQRYNELMKILQQGNQQKQVMTMLFEKIFLVEEGKEERMKKRFRRKKDEIQGKYGCRDCNKVYSSSTSLARHAKLKHPYSTAQPPQRDYHIPPQPNSINQSQESERICEGEKMQKKVRRQKSQEEFNEGDFDSQSVCLSHSDENDGSMATPKQPS